jgi:hypothetical protein
MVRTIWILPFFSSSWIVGFTYAYQGWSVSFDNALCTATIVQLVTFTEVDTRIYKPRHIIFIFNKSWYPSNWKSLIVILYDTFFFISFTLKIRFHHNVCFGWDWCKTLECYINRTLRHARWINVIYTGPYVMRGEYNVLSKIVTRDVSQSEKNQYLKSYNNVRDFVFF